MLFSGVHLIHGQNSYEQIYNEFRAKATQTYANYRDQAHRDYIEWMKKAWDEFTAAPPKVIPEEETLPPVIISEDEKIKPMRNIELKVEVIIPPVISIQPLPHEKIVEIPLPEPKYVNLQFYGTDIRIRFEDCQKLELSSCSNQDISSFWESIVDDEYYNNTVRDCLESRIKLQLCDWAYLQLVEMLTKSCAISENEATLMMAFILCQTGYKIRIGKDNDKIYLLYSSTHYIYGVSPFIIDGEYFYPYGKDVEHLYITNFTFPFEKSVSLWIEADPLFTNDDSEARTIKSERFSDFTLTSNVNKNLIDFYNTYPPSAVDDNFMTKWAMYANTPLSKTTKDRLYPQIKTAISGLTELEAANKIINIIQTGFEYKLDDLVWGHDRAFFSEESLYYPYCDCEDRSILFSRIVRDLLDLDVVLVYYPGHLATAVAFNNDVEGDYIMIANRKFTVSDPTYIGARIGQTMPDMDNQTSKVILLKK